MLEIFFTKIEDADWGTYYLPTTLGYTILALIMIALLLVAVAIIGKKNTRMKTKDLAFCSLSMALAFVSGTFFKILPLPFGGSLTLFSMMFITIIGYWYGLRVSLTVAISYGLLQFITNPFMISIPQVLFDYIFAFGALGLSGVFCNKKHGLVKGYLLGITGRFIFSFLSGIIFFASSAVSWNMSAPIYSLLYNGMYIYGEGIITVILFGIKPVYNAFLKIKTMAVS